MFGCEFKGEHIVKSLINNVQLKESSIETETRRENNSVLSNRKESMFSKNKQVLSKLDPLKM